MSAAAQVGVVGLGAMGGPIAGHLARAGHRVAGFDLDPSVAAGIPGVEPVGSAPGAAEGAAAVLVVVPTDEDARTVCLGPVGLLASCAAGTVVMLCSSLRPDTCQEIAAAAPQGVDVVDAALTGGVRAARAGTVNLLVGGDRAVVDRLRPILRPWTATVHHLGPLGAGQVGKTANNMLHWAQICAIAEAFELARRHGVAGAALRQALMDGPTDSRTLRELHHMRLTWHAKDLANAAVMAGEVDLPVPVAELSRRLMPAISTDDIARLLDGTPPERSSE